MVSPLKKVPWSPESPESDGHPPGFAWKRLLVVGTITVIAWIGLALVLQSKPVQTDEQAILPSTTERVGPYNIVEVTNDSTEALYFARCSNDTCSDLVNGEHRGDYNLITPGNIDRLEVFRGKDQHSYFAVIDDSRTRRGCLDFAPDNDKQPAKHVKLSQVIVDCSSQEVPLPSSSQV